MDETRSFSLKHAAEQRAALLAQADQVWRDAAKELERRIPESMRGWAHAHGYIESSAIGGWKLPQWLDSLVRNGGELNKLLPSRLARYSRAAMISHGFADFYEFKRGVTALAKAWENIVCVEFCDSRDTTGVCLDVMFSIAEA